MHKIHVLFLTTLPLLLFVSCKQSKYTQVNTIAKKEIRFSFYNVENLFDAVDDPKVNDNDFTPTGKYKWTTKNYKTKLNNISKVINELDADVVGLAEIENEQVIIDLIAKLKPESKYKYIHYESHDKRGIDVALLYKATTFEFLESTELEAKLKNGKFAGPRDILKTTFKYNKSNFCIYVNHWPSRKLDRVSHRIAYSYTIQEDIKTNLSDCIVVMGDFNDTPQDSSLKNMVHNTGLKNPFESYPHLDKGTTTYNNKWLLFDQILYKISNTFTLSSFTINNFEYLKLNSLKKSKKSSFPRRHIIGARIDEHGYSDHFPVSLEIKTGLE